MSETLIDIFLYLTYALALGGLVLAIVFPILFMVKNPSKAKGALMGVGILVVIYGLSYMLANNEVLDYYPKFGVDAGWSKLIGGSLISLYILSIIAVIGAIGAEVLRFFK